MAGKRKPIEYYVNENGCHICTSHAKTHNGYNQCQYEGFYRLHRYIHWKNTGERPKTVLHICNNPACINPEHLKAGTRESNMQYMALCGNQKNQKITAEQALAIFNDPRTNSEIAKDYNIDRHHVGDIKRGKKWSHITKGG